LTVDGTPQQLTADKRLRFTSPKLPSATSFIREPLSAHCGQERNKAMSKIKVNGKSSFKNIFVCVKMK